MTMKWISVCLVAVAMLGCLSDAQFPKQPQQPQQPKYTPLQPQQPQTQKYTPPAPPKLPQRPQPPPQKYVPPQTPQQPQQPQQPKQHTKQPQTEQSFHTCEVDNNYKIQCGPEGVSAGDCDAINCCFDGRMCYYGKAVTVQCTKDAQFIVVVARDATLPNIDLESVSLLGDGQGCAPVGTTSAFAIYQFPVTACGTVMMEEPGVITYENRMSSSYEVAVGSKGAITRDSTYELLFQCRYIGTSVEALVVEVNLVPPPPPVAAPGPLHVELRLANGQCTAKGCVEEEVAYSSFYTDGDYPVTKVLRDPVYVEVRMLERTDPNIVLTLGRCWATCDSNPYSLPQWDLLIDGCPYLDDRYQTTLAHVGASSGLMYPTHHRRFIFKMFTFVDQTTLSPLREKVFIHCNAAVCQPSASDNCEPRCFRKRRDIGSAVQTTARTESTLVTSKEIIMTDDSVKS
ncbi:zona pellucida sperm-binding protein 4-like [Centroberyx affinis]|uniref:zona pellucida sperm-binding protein 4-like n=1 Tax=Centroberyx affinis TaxID=166261 RepID=UPI003A5BFC13